jgi:hypothetical protein
VLSLAQLFEQAPSIHHGLIRVAAPTPVSGRCPQHLVGDVRSGFPHTNQSSGLHPVHRPTPCTQCGKSENARRIIRGPVAGRGPGAGHEPVRSPTCRPAQCAAAVQLQLRHVRRAQCKRPTAPQNFGRLTRGCIERGCARVRAKGREQASLSEGE